MPHRLLLLALCLVLMACERPFVDVRSPDIEVVAPDFSTVFLEDEAVLRVRASSFRDVERVEIGGLPLAFDAASETWTAPLKFGRGVNVIRLSAFDVEGIERVDTLYAVHLPMRLSPDAPILGASLGGHTTTVLPLTGDVLVTGGSERSGGVARDEALRLRFGNDRFEPMTARLHAARTGHTATRLPDGRVLFLGGATTDDLTEVSQTVEVAELFDAEVGTFKTIPVIGAPIRRMMHTAVVRQNSAGPIIDLLGGRGDVQYTPPRLGTRRDIRSFQLVNDTLFALSPAPGPFIAPIAGHTEVPTSSLNLGEAGPYLIVGSFFLDGATDDTSFILDYRDPLGLLPEPTALPLISRTRHTAISLGRGYVVLLGGRQATAASALGQAEVYVRQVDRYYKFPENSDASLLPRFAHTATIALDGRILLLGGFGPDGTGTRSAEYVRFDL